jgi:hypothetical protein
VLGSVNDFSKKASFFGEFVKWPKIDDELRFGSEFCKF